MVPFGTTTCASQPRLISTEKALQEFDSLFSDTRKLLLSTIHAEGHFFHTAAAPAALGGAQTANATRSKDRGISERTAKVLKGALELSTSGAGVYIRLSLFRLNEASSRLQSDPLTCGRHFQVH